MNKPEFYIHTGESSCFECRVKHGRKTYSGFGATRIAAYESLMSSVEPVKVKKDKPKDACYNCGISRGEATGQTREECREYGLSEEELDEIFGEEN